MNVLPELRSRLLRSLPYVLAFFSVALSYLIWWKFASPPINSNIGFDLYPWRQVAQSSLPYNSYIWPGSYVPWVLGAPPQIYYGVFFSLSGGNYGVADFLAFTSIDGFGAVALYYLLQRFLSRFLLDLRLAWIGVLFYVFNGYRVLSGFGTTDGYLSAGLFTAGDPATILVLAALTHLTLFRRKEYALLLGGFSFFAFSNFPTATLVLSQEYAVVLAIMLAYRCEAYWKASKLGALKRSLKGLGVAGTAVVIANSYLLLPAFNVADSFSRGVGAANTTFAFSYSFDSHQNLTNGLRLATNWALFAQQAPPWVSAYLNSPIVILGSLLVPILALAALFFLRRPVDLALYSFMLLAWAISASDHPPFGAAFVQLTSSVLPFRGFYNGEIASPLLLVLMSAFAVIGLGKIELAVRRAYSRPKYGHRPVASTHRVSAQKRGARISRSLGTRSIPLAVSAIIVLSAYPALTPNFSASHSEGFPIQSTLPSAYQKAASYLANSAPDSPVMVFPASEPFDSNSNNGTTWYYGIDIYPNILGNPSITSSYPTNYHGEDGDALPAPAFIYEMGGRTCSSTECQDGGVNTIPLPATSVSNASGDFVSSNETLINWQIGTPSDSETFESANNSTAILFRVNASISQSNGHWILGYFPDPVNLSAYQYAEIEVRLSGTVASDIQFGYHSYTPFGSGNGYFLGSYGEIAPSRPQTLFLPLADPSVKGGGSLDNVSNLFLVDDSMTHNWIDNLTIMSIRFVNLLPGVAPDWKAGALEDSVGVQTFGESSGLSFVVDQDSYESNGHWALGYLPQPENLSSYSFAILNYTLSGGNPSFLQFGFHSGTQYGSGNGYPIGNYITFTNRGRFTSIVPLSAPTLIDGGNLSQVTNFYLVYTPPYSATGVVSINLSSVRLSQADPVVGGALANGLSRLGVEFALVDSSIVKSTFPSFTGGYYDSIFESSPFFELEFHAGDISIFRDELYGGQVTSPGKISNLRGEVALVGAYDFPFASVFYNATNEGVGYVSSLGSLNPSTYRPADISSVAQSSPTQYTIAVSTDNESILEFRTLYSPSWTATILGTSKVLEHVEADGFANAWIIPPGRYDITITLTGSVTFEILEVSGLLVPFVMFAVFFSMPLFPIARRLVARLS